MSVSDGGVAGPALGFAAAGVMMTWGFVLPAALIEREGRKRAVVEERMHGMRLAALRAELDALRARTQPHFLFNALNTIASLIQEDSDLAEATVERLAGVLHYVLRHSREDTVALADEVAMLDAYLEIQHARFGSRLTHSIEVEPGLETARMPPLLLQALVENAVSHGIATRSNGGHVTVIARSDDGMLELVVRGGRRLVVDCARRDRRGSPLGRVLLKSGAPVRRCRR